jgi:transcriptional regulator with XRE-family HTH domain
MSRSEHDRALYTAIGGMIRAARLNGGLSQVALARSIGIFPASLARAEAGRQRLTVETVYRYAAALHVDPKGLLP